MHPLIRPPLQQCKSGLSLGIREVASLEGHNLPTFYNLNAFEIWPDKRGGFWWEWPDKRENYCISFCIWSCFP